MDSRSYNGNQVVIEKIHIFQRTLLRLKGNDMIIKEHYINIKVITVLRRTCCYEGNPCTTHNLFVIQYIML